MKESEQIRQEMLDDDSDNDFRALNYFKKIERAEKLENFTEFVLPELKKKYNVTEHETDFIIETEKFGKLTYYPKSNSLCIHKNNYWAKKFGLQWIKKYLLR